MKIDRKSGFLIALCIFFLFSLLLVVKVNYEKHERKILYESIIQIIKKYENGESKCINLGNVNEISWEKLYIFGSYSYPEDIDTKLGTFWLGSRFTQIKYSDAVILLVFVKDNHVSQYVEFYKGDGDFSGNKTGLIYNKNEAKFVENEKGEITPISCNSNNCCN